MCTLHETMDPKTQVHDLNNSCGEGDKIGWFAQDGAMEVSAQHKQILQSQNLRK